MSPGHTTEEIDAARITGREEGRAESRGGLTELLARNPILSHAFNAILMGAAATYLGINVGGSGKVTSAESTANATIVVEYWQALAVETTIELQECLEAKP